MIFRAPASAPHRLLLREALDVLVRAGETPLAARINGAGIADAAGRALHSKQPSTWAALQKNPRIFTRELDACLGEALEGPCPGEEPPASWTGSPPYSPEVSAALGPWLEQRCVLLRSVDSNALKILDLRLQGSDDSEISETLGLGPRLVRSILRDLSAAFRGDRP